MSWRRPSIDVFGKSFASYRVCAGAGLIAGVSLALYLAEHAGLARSVVLAMFAASLIAFVALALATKLWTGRETLVYYRHEIAIVVVLSSLLSLGGLPVLAYLDVALLGLGLILALGRVGCLMVGCCHGHPHRFGVRYGVEHFLDGFPQSLVGVRLFPVQALEATLLVVIVATGSVMSWRGAPPGVVFSHYVVVYGLARFYLEFLRGDSARGYWLGFSEAQWTSLVLVAGAVLAEARGQLPSNAWHSAAFASLVVTMLAFRASGKPETALRTAHHVRELADALLAAKGPAQQPRVTHTSLGIRISCGRLGPGAALTQLCSLSRIDPPLTEREARAMAKITRLLASRDRDAVEFVPGHHGVFHVVFHAIDARSSSNGP